MRLTSSLMIKFDGIWNDRLVASEFIWTSCCRCNTLLRLDSIDVMYGQGSLKGNLVNGFTNGHVKEIIIQFSYSIQHLVLCPFT
jgi:hypothetical protein